MTSFPFPVRVAAGLAATAAREARNLPKHVTEVPVTVVSQALQWSMRVQQEVTELAIQGDEVLASLRPVEETPEWATFDEDEPDSGTAAASPASPPRESRRPRGSAFDRVGESEPEHSAAAEPDATTTSDAAATAGPTNTSGGPEALPNYDNLTLAQLRGHLRRLSQPALEQLLAHERAHADRERFVRMLSNRIENLRGAAARNALDHR